MSKQIILASNNQKKCHELQTILSTQDIDLVPQSQFNIASVEETGLTFVENALIKARHACLHTGLPALADDSGIEVFALNGEPGIYSARYASEQANDHDNVEQLLTRLSHIPQGQRQARFVCVIVLLKHTNDPTPLICEGYWAGEITMKASGHGGFGYDPIFYVPDYGCTSAELSPEQKNHISHRGQALAQLSQRLTSYSQSYPQV